jgi:hypothetical protein
MAIGDCVKCWDTPCTCGWDWRHSSVEYLEKQRELLDKAIQWKKDHPAANFSGFSGPDTEDDIAFMRAIGSMR